MRPGSGPPASGVVRGARLVPLVVADRILHEVAVRGRMELVDSDDVGAALSMISSTGRDRLTGVLRRQDVSALMRLVPARVRLDGTVVDLAAYLGADIDPLAASTPVSRPRVPSGYSLNDHGLRGNLTARQGARHARPGRYILIMLRSDGVVDSAR